MTKTIIKGGETQRRFCRIITATLANNPHSTVEVKRVADELGIHKATLSSHVRTAAARGYPIIWNKRTGRRSFISRLPGEWPWNDKALEEAREEKPLDTFSATCDRLLALPEAARDGVITALVELVEKAEKSHRETTLIASKLASLSDEDRETFLSLLSKKA